MQCRGVAAEHQRLQRFAGGVHHGSAGILEQPWQFVPEFFPQFVVEVCKWFIQKHQRRILDQRPRQRGALLLPTRQFAREPVKQRFQFEQLRNLSHAIPNTIF